MSHCQQNAVHHIINVTPGADLGSVSMDLNGLILECSFDECPQCAFANLSGTVNIKRAYDSGWQPFLLEVSDRQMFLSKLAYCVCPPRLTYVAHYRSIRLCRTKSLLPKHLTCRKADDSVDAA